MSLWKEYILYGGLPQVSLLSDVSSKISYLNSIFNNTSILRLLQSQWLLLLVPSWLTSCYPTSNSTLSSAINYMNDCWDDLFVYLDNGCTEIYNNSADHAVKPFVV